MTGFITFSKISFMLYLNIDSVYLYACKFIVQKISMN